MCKQLSLPQKWQGSSERQNLYKPVSLASSFRTHKHGTDVCVFMGGSLPRTFLSCARFKAYHGVDVPGFGPQRALNLGGVMGATKKDKEKKKRNKQIK